MVKKVLKFGGTSVGTSERIKHVAKIIKKEQSSGAKVIAVLSAMAGKTDELIKLSNEIIDAAKETGNSVKRKEQDHKMADANKAFAHMRY